MGLLSWLSGKHMNDGEEHNQFRDFTNDKRWDVLLDLLYQRIEKQNDEWHNMGPEQRDGASVRQKLLYEVLNDIEDSGGRVEMNAVVPFEPEEAASEITPYRHLGVPHMIKLEHDEAVKAEKIEREKEESNAG